MLTNPLAKTIWGERAIHVPAWMYVRDVGDGTVCFAGASRLPVETHPLRLGSSRDVQFLNGDIVVRAAEARGTDIFQGYTIGQLLTNPNGDPDFMASMLDKGEIIYP